MYNVIYIGKGMNVALRYSCGVGVGAGVGVGEVSFSRIFPFFTVCLPTVIGPKVLHLKLEVVVDLFIL